MKYTDAVTKQIPAFFFKYNQTLIYLFFLECFYVQDHQKEILIKVTICSAQNLLVKLMASINTEQQIQIMPVKAMESNAST